MNIWFDQSELGGQLSSDMVLFLGICQKSLKFSILQSAKQFEYLIWPGGQLSNGGVSGQACQTSSAHLQSTTSYQTRPLLPQGLLFFWLLCCTWHEERTNHWPPVTPAFCIPSLHFYEVCSVNAKRFFIIGKSLSSPTKQLNIIYDQDCTLTGQPICWIDETFVVRTLAKPNAMGGKMP